MGGICPREKRTKVAFGIIKWLGVFVLEEAEAIDQLEIDSIRRMAFGVAALPIINDPETGDASSGFGESHSEFIASPVSSQ